MRTEPVLLVHGFASSFERNWREPGWADLLHEAGREVIGFDLPGHGNAPKPYEPEAYAHAMETVGATAEECWIVGDNLEWEVAAPQKLGLYAVWHDHLGDGLPPGSEVRPDRIIQSLSELLPREFSI